MIFTQNIQITINIYSKSVLLLLYSPEALRLARQQTPGIESTIWRSVAYYFPPIE